MMAHHRKPSKKSFWVKRLNSVRRSSCDTSDTSVASDNSTCSLLATLKTTRTYRVGAACTNKTIRHSVSDRVDSANDAASTTSFFTKKTVLCSVHNEDTIKIEAAETNDSIETKSMRRIKKKVRFARSGRRIKIASCHDMVNQEKRDLWYTPAERVAMRQQGRRSAIQAVGIRRDCAEEPLRMFMTIRHLACTSDKHRTDLLLNDRERMAKLSRGILHWSQGSFEEDDTYRGLEGYVAALRIEREEAAQAAREMIVDTSQDSSSQGAFDAADMAKEYQEMSRLSIILARVVGEADAVAAAQDKLIRERKLMWTST